MTAASIAVAPAYDPGPWHTYFTLIGTAAATLTGLFFVAFSLRVPELQLSLELRTRARYLLIWLIAIVIGSAFVLMPGQSRAALATEILVVTVAFVAYTVWSVLRTARGPLLSLFSLSAHSAIRWLSMGTTWLLTIGAGISLLVGHGGGLYLLAFGLLLGTALQVTAAWTLVVETGKHTRVKGAVAGQEQRAEPPTAEPGAQG
jgi:hypothetical protein